MHKVFMSYRRSDSASVCGRIYDRLVASFDRDTIFKDVDAIPYGADFRAYIENIIGQCPVALVVIGPGWLSAANPDGTRRLDDPNDLVRIEIETVLARNIRVVPVLVEGAKSPAVHELPQSLAPLVQQNTALLRNDPDFDTDMRRLIATLEESLGLARPEGMSDILFQEWLVKAAWEHQYAKKDYEGTVQYARRAIRLNPEAWQAYESLASALTDLGRWEEALAVYDQEIALLAARRKVADSDMLRGQHSGAYLYKGMLAEKHERFEEALNSYLGMWNVWNIETVGYEMGVGTYSRLMGRLGRDRQLVAELNVYLELHPQFHSLWLAKGDALERLGIPNEALAAYDQVLALSQGKREVPSEAWSRKGLVFAKLGRPRDALACFDQSLALTENKEVLNYKGCELGKLGRHKEAVAVFDRALQLDPKFDAAASNRTAALRASGR